MAFGLLSSCLQAAEAAKGGDNTANTAAFSARLPSGPPVIGAWFPQDNPFFPAFGPVTSSFRGLPQKANSLQ